MKSKRIVILGATSAIAIETAKLYASDGAAFCLVARDADKLDSVAGDLKARGAIEVKTVVGDFSDFSTHRTILDEVENALPDYDSVLVAYGSLPDQARCQTDREYALAQIELNFTSIVSLLTPIAETFESRKKGTIAVISSVAGERGRMSNYVYGAAKGALSVFLEGLQHRLSKHSVQVIIIKPGFVDTPMTADMKKGALFVGPDRIAVGIYKAMENGTREAYLPWFWWPIMTTIKNVPAALFHKTSL